MHSISFRRLKCAWLSGSCAAWHWEHLEWSLVNEMPWGTLMVHKLVNKLIVSNMII